jgi:hypothetical protein
MSDTTKYPLDFELTVEQAAKECNVSTDIIRRNLQRDPADRWYLKSRRHTPRGAIRIEYGWLLEYKERTTAGYRMQVA